MKRVNEIIKRIISVVIVLQYTTLLIYSSIHFHNYCVDNTDVIFNNYESRSFIDPFNHKNNTCTLLTFQNSKTYQCFCSQITNAFDLEKFSFFTFIEADHFSISLNNQTLRAPPILS